MLLNNPNFQNWGIFSFNKNKKLIKSLFQNHLKIVIFLQRMFGWMPKFVSCENKQGNLFAVRQNNWMKCETKMREMLQFNEKKKNVCSNACVEM